MPVPCSISYGDIQNIAGFTLGSTLQAKLQGQYIDVSGSLQTVNHNEGLTSVYWYAGVERTLIATLDNADNGGVTPQEDGSAIIVINTQSKLAAVINDYVEVKITWTDPGGAVHTCQTFTLGVGF